MKKFILTVLAIGALLNHQSEVLAEEDASKPPITVTPIFTEQQVEGNNSFFQFNIEEGQDTLEQPLTLSIENVSDTNQSIRLVPLSTTFSGHGSFEYNEGEPVNNQELTNDTFDMKKYLTTSKEDYVIEPGKEIEVGLNLNFNAKESGQYMGGLGVKLINNEAQGVDNFGVATEVRYVVAATLTKGKRPESSFEFGEDEIGVQPHPTYYDIMMPIHHKSASILTNAIIKYQVLDGTKSLFNNGDGAAFNFSPHSKTKVSFPWVDGDLEVGKSYNLKGTLEYTEMNTNKQVSLPFGGKFTYTGNEAYAYEGQDINKPQVKEEGNFNPLWLLPLLLIPIAIVGKTLTTKRYIYITSADTPVISLLHQEEEQHLSRIGELREYSKGHKYEGIAPEESLTYVGHMYHMKKRKLNGKYVNTYEFKKTIDFSKSSK